MNIKKKYDAFIKYFSENNPNASSELAFKNVYELTIAVVLSAQCTDKRVNIITPPFFKKYPDIKSLSKANVEQIFELIKSCSYPNSKAKYLSGISQKVISDFEGKIPHNIDDLQKLPGIGRKSANVIASVAFGIAAMPVDTHVFRVSARIGLTINAKTPLETEKQLTKYIPQNQLSLAHHWLILHGRYVCKARKPLCESCQIKNICDYYNKIK